MTDLETAAAALLLRLDALHTGAEDAREALQDTREELEQAQEQTIDHGRALVEETNQALAGLNQLRSRLQEDGGPALRAVLELEHRIRGAEAALRAQLQACEHDTRDLGETFESEAVVLVKALDAIHLRATALSRHLLEANEALDEALDGARQLLEEDFSHVASVITEDVDVLTGHIHEWVTAAVDGISPMGDAWPVAVAREWQESLREQGLETVRDNLDTVLRAAQDGFREARQATLAELGPVAARVEACGAEVVKAVFDASEAVGAAQPVEAEMQSLGRALDEVLDALERLSDDLARLTFQ